MGRACSTNEEKGNLYGMLVRKPEGKRPQNVGGWVILKWILEI
jgi:hypothetical protein